MAISLSYTLGSPEAAVVQDSGSSTPSVLETRNRIGVFVPSESHECVVT